jgi:HPt (histidine-containing phosphotransfer) domain-containing protein
MVEFELESFDVIEVAKSMNMDEEMFLDIIELFFENIYQDLDNLKDTIANKDFETLSKHAHKIAGATGAVRFNKARTIAKEIELYAKDQQNANYLELFEKLQNVIKQYKLLIYKK